MLIRHFDDKINKKHILVHFQESYFFDVKMCYQIATQTFKLLNEINAMPFNKLLFMSFLKKNLFEFHLELHSFITNSI